jgi:restriction system protein
VGRDLDREVIYKALLQLLGDSKTYLTRDIENGVADLIQLDEETRTSIHSGSRTKLGYKLAWARTRAKKEGLIERVGPSLWRMSNPRIRE